MRWGRRSSEQHLRSRPSICGWTYQLKRFVEVVFKYHLENRFKFNTMSEACSFMDLPTDLEQLRGRQRRIREAIAMRAR